MKYYTVESCSSRGLFGHSLSRTTFLGAFSSNTYRLDLEAGRLFCPLWVWVYRILLQFHDTLFIFYSSSSEGRRRSSILGSINQRNISTVSESKNELGIIMEDDDADHKGDNSGDNHLPNNEPPQQPPPPPAKQNAENDLPDSEPPPQLQQHQRPMQPTPSIFISEEPTVVQPGDTGDNTTTGQQKDNW